MWNNDRVQLVMCVDIMSRVIWSVNITLCNVFFFVWSLREMDMASLLCVDAMK